MIEAAVTGETVKTELEPSGEANGEANEETIVEKIEENN